MSLQKTSSKFSVKFTDISFNLKTQNNVIYNEK